MTKELGQLGEELLGKTSGKCKPRKDTWWWNDEIQQCLKRKKEAKKTLDRYNTEENKEAYIVAKKEAKRKVASAKARSCKVLCEAMDSSDGQKQVLRMANQ